MFEIPIHVIDFEGSRQSGVVEYGCVTLENGEITNAQTRICAPVGKITDLDLSKHGISKSSASKEAPFSADWSLFAGLRETGPFCAHNSAVEEDFLRAVWPFPRNSPDFSKPDLYTVTWGPWLDTLYVYRRIYPLLNSYKLKDLVQLFDIQGLLDKQAAKFCPLDRCRYHCALFDALASTLLLNRLHNESSLETATLHWLFLQSAASDASRDIISQQKLL